MTGTTAVDSFKDPVPKEETMVAVIDCGGTARCGTYPRIGIPTINVKVMSPSGPLAKFMTEDIFVSGVTPEDLENVSDGETQELAATKSDSETQSGNEDIKQKSKKRNKNISKRKKYLKQNDAYH